MSLYNIFKKSVEDFGVRDNSRIREEIAKNGHIFDNLYGEISSDEALKGNIGDFVFRALAEKPFRTALVDYCTGEPRRYSAGMLLAIAIEISKFIKKNINGHRVAVALPPCALSYATNMAIIFSAKVPVNINFSLGQTTITESLKKSGCDVIFSANEVLKRFPNFPRNRTIVDITKIIGEVSKARLIATFCEVCIFPTWYLTKKYKIPQTGGKSEAVLLFSSGTTGIPKGVPLSHANIICNCLQLNGAGLCIGRKSVLSNLPIFHSFGMTVNMWFAVIMQRKVVTVSSPLDYKIAADAIFKEEIDMFVSAPTFLRPYVLKIDSQKLKSLKCTIVGAERVPSDLVDTWEKKFGSQLLAGYGLTETSPVISVNYPQANNGRFDQQVGSVGRLLPGIAVKFIGPETKRTLPIGETGILCVKGASVFGGYLCEPEKTNEILKNGWLVTGDLARLTADGFLYIDGRVSRFSKIGGEMVPHVGIEEAIIKLLAIQQSNFPKIAVISRIDGKKGERISLLTSVHIDQQELTSKMIQAGYSTLWVPREIVEVDKIPFLVTGKVDIGRCKTLLMEHVTVEK